MSGLFTSIASTWIITMFVFKAQTNTAYMRVAQSDRFVCDNVSFAIRPLDPINHWAGSGAFTDADKLVR